MSFNVLDEPVIVRSSQSIPGPSKEEVALDIVVDVMERLNKGSHQPFSNKESPAMTSIQREMDRIIEVIHVFVKSSLALVDSEGTYTVSPDVHMTIM